MKKNIILLLVLCVGLLQSCRTAAPPRQPEDHSVSPFVIIIRGFITNSEGKPLDADIQLEDLSSGEQIAGFKTNNGNYEIKLIAGKKYGWRFEKPGCYPLARNLETRNAVESFVLDSQHVVLSTIEELQNTSAAIAANNIFFNYDSADLQPESYPEIGRLAEILKANKKLKLQVVGHTSSEGIKTHNQELSEKRAKAVVEYLAKLGCDAGNLSCKGLGATKPIASNDKEEDRHRNRRVEIIFLKR